MRVLWFSLTPSNYKKAKGLGYNGGGWIASLETELVKQKSIDLGVAFFSGTVQRKEKEGDVFYYLMPHPRKKIRSKINFFIKYDAYTEIEPYLPVFKHVVDDFKPDIIQVFGSESMLGFVKLVADVPCVLHIQGIIEPCLNAFYPPSFSKFTFLFRSLNPLKILAAYKDMVTWKNNAIRERYLFSIVDNYIGRTDWDRVITSEFNSLAAYYYGSEILRESFYKPIQRKNPCNLVIVSTLSGVSYKGIDVLLKTAKVLKVLMNKDFLWVVYGSVSNVSFFERQTNIYATDVNVNFKGVGTESDVYNSLCNATVFVHTSYIDNSPNAICEAQMVGCPVVSSNVGGIASLVKDGVSGFLVPANDPYTMAWKIINLYTDRNLNEQISANAKKIAVERHDKNKVVCGLINIYNKIIND